MHVDWGVTAATILLTGVTAFVTVYVERLRTAKKSILFTVLRPEPISEAIRRHGRFFEIKIGERTTQELTLAGVFVENNGNLPVEALTFDVSVPGKHTFVFADWLAANPKLREDIKIVFDTSLSKFTVSLPYCNPKESFLVKSFFDGEVVPCEITCRLPGVKVKILTLDIVEREERRRHLLDRVKEMAFAIVVLTTLIAGLAIAFPRLFFVDHPSRPTDNSVQSQ